MHNVVSTVETSTFFSFFIFFFLNSLENINVFFRRDESKGEKQRERRRGKEGRKEGGEWGNKFFRRSNDRCRCRFPILFPPRNYSTYHEIIKVVDRSSIAQVACTKRGGGEFFHSCSTNKIRRVLPSEAARTRHFRPRRLTLNYSRTRRPDEDFIKIAAAVIAVGFAKLKDRQRESERAREREREKRRENMTTTTTTM